MRSEEAIADVGHSGRISDVAAGLPIGRQI